ncbi:ferredoxin domain-containing protein [Dendrosporobacter sp. 1207_IL3150]|uniref:ferredoxin domain-containing protein n=1 Tax=Dendrosporobacter sp. 1207_IL3150 TaxID=3084054 RepID=UPI002FDA4E94
MITKSKEIEERAIERVADSMCVAARTAPKGKGIDNLVTMTVKGGIKNQLVDEMRRIAKSSGAQFFERDANCVEKASLVVLMGQKVRPNGVPNCGYCGYANCEENAKKSGLCAISIGDLGIAMGSAVSIAAHNHVDNRIMFSIGRAALNLDLFEENVAIAYGIPLSVSGKSPFHDRG